MAAACSNPESPAEQTAAAPSAPKPAPAALPDSVRRPSFTWEDEVCLNKGYFAPGQYTQQQLRDTHKLINYPGIAETRDIWHLAEMQPDTIAQRISQLDQEYAQRLAELRALQVVPQAYWRKLQQLRVLELEESYRLTRLTFQGHVTPGVLVGASSAPACQAYAQVLASPDTAVLVRAWRRLVDEQKTHNSVPASLEAEFQQQNHSPERLQYARLELMKYGWWNCVNGMKKYGDVYDQQQPSLAFDKLFTKVERTDCADVD
ncbi:hypothetical protein [Hymenobacter sp. CRA2]|uniref:hypothetical protein n=1 Tax=Hymenobacter sp. CRA2 TaxID=1955620 RepID=UPI00098F962D|nr:hypothetical protein [Hymenobacter sp. CRA2]OON67476.1 hypothetical protein B0919_18655 [Hymenobacter sp. CRA2]